MHPAIGSPAAMTLKRFIIERDITGIGEFSLTELCGLPLSRVTEVPQIIDPLTANNRDCGFCRSPRD